MSRKGNKNNIEEPLTSLQRDNQTKEDKLKRIRRV